MFFPHIRPRDCVLCFPSLIWLAIISVGAAFLPVSAVVKVLLVIILWSMLFAWVLEGSYEPFAIQKAPLTRVLFESEKDRVADVEGKVIFDLDRYLLLLTENKSGGSAVANPTRENRVNAF